MGIQSASFPGLATGTVSMSTRLKWLFTPSDPRLPLAGGGTQCNVHAPLDWLSWKTFNGTTWTPHNLGTTGSLPDPVLSNSLEYMTGRFWNGYGIGSEIHAFNGPGGSSDPFASVDYVTRSTNCEK